MKKFFKSTYFAIILLFIYLPIGVMVLFSFNSGSTVFSFLSFSTEWYGEFFRNTPFLNSILTSLFIAVVSTVVSVLIGVAAAIGLSRTKAVTQRAWFSIANIPLINADVVTAISLMVVFLLLGFQFGAGTLLMAHISFNVPYVLITVMPRLRKVDKSLLEAASDLGAKYWQVVFKVILPVLKPAIITATVVAFSMSFDDFIISYFTGGDQTNVSTFIYTARRIRPYIFAFGTILVGVIVLSVLVWNVFQFTKTKRLQVEEELKSGWYKSKELNKYYKELETLYSQLNNKSRTYKSKNPMHWSSYWWYEFVLKLYSIRNFDRKISKLEWKQYKLRNEISNEKRYYANLKSTNKNIAKIEAEISKKSEDAKNLKRVAKLQLRLEKLLDKQEFLEAEIQWIENRDERQADKVAKISKRIRNLERELESQKGELSKADLVWYHKKIKSLTEYKIELEEGKNHYKLRMVVEELRQTRELRNNKIYELEHKVEWAYGRVNRVRPLESFYRNSKFVKDNGLAKDAFLSREINKLELKINKVEEQVVGLEAKIEQKRAKVLPPNNPEDQVRSKPWIARSWKTFLAVLVGLGAFSGLTVAYVRNNIYDLTIGNWGEYIDPDILMEFQEKTGYRLNYQVYDTNETLYNKLYTFTYDLMIPSDYMIEQLIAEDRLRELDYEQISQFQTEDETTAWSPDDYADYLTSGNTGNDGPFSEGSDFRKYAVPYFWGDVVIIFNVNNAGVQRLLTNNNLTVSDDNTIDQANWNLVKQAVDSGLNVTLNNDPKNLFLIANEILFQTANAITNEQVDQAYDYLYDVVRPGNVAIQGDDMLASIINGTFDVAIMYSGDAVLAVSEYLASNPNNQPFALARPNAEGQGTNVYFDAMVISNNSPHELAAYRFMNFLRDKSADNSRYVGLASTFKSVMDEVSQTDFSNFAAWYVPPYGPGQTNRGESFVFNRDLDRYLVQKYNNLLASK